MKLDIKKYEEKMRKSVDAYADDLSTMRVGKANPEVLARIEFE